MLMLLCVAQCNCLLKLWPYLIYDNIFSLFHCIQLDRTAKNAFYVFCISIIQSDFCSVVSYILAVLVCSV